MGWLFTKRASAYSDVEELERLSGALKIKAKSYLPDGERAVGDFNDGVNWGLYYGAHALCVVFLTQDVKTYEDAMRAFAKCIGIKDETEEEHAVQG